MPSSVYLLWLAKSKLQVVYKTYLVPERAKDESIINGNPLLQCVRSGALTLGLSSLSWDGKQRHLVYLKKASTFISHSRVAWLDPWLWSLRHIFLPTRDCPFAWHRTKPAGLKLQHHSIQFVSDKRTNKQWVRCKHRWCITSLQSNNDIFDQLLVSQRVFPASMGTVDTCTEKPHSVHMRLDRTIVSLHSSQKIWHHLV